MVTPSPQLLKDIRADLVQRGTSLAAFCTRHGFVRQAVGPALSGKRLGPRSRQLAETFVAKVRETA
jgi:lambda repressor-like predicted transcriptional regulator